MPISLSSLYDEVELTITLVPGEKAGLGISDDAEDGSRNRVVSVTPGSPAAAAGCKAYDLVLAVDGIECSAIKSAISIWLNGAGKQERRLRVRRAMNPAAIKAKTDSFTKAAAAERDGGAGSLPRLDRQGRSASSSNLRPSSSRSGLGLGLPPIAQTPPGGARRPTATPPSSRLKGKELILAQMRAPERQLRNAATRGDDAAIRALIEEHEEAYEGGGALDIDAADSHGFTALMLACFNGHASTATLLLSKGAQLPSVNVVGKTALDLARSQGRTKIVTILEAFRKRDERKRRKPQPIGAGDPAEEEEALRQMMGASWRRSPGLRVARLLHRPGSPPPVARPGSSPRPKMRKDGAVVLSRRTWDDLVKGEGPRAQPWWWWADRSTTPKTKRGPLTELDMYGLRSRGTINDETLIWRPPDMFATFGEGPIGIDLADRTLEAGNGADGDPDGEDGNGGGDGADSGGGDGADGQHSQHSQHSQHATAVVVVAGVAEGSAAEAQGLRAGLVLAEVNGASVRGLDRAGVLAMATAAPRPLRLKLYWPALESWQPFVAVLGEAYERWQRRIEEEAERQRRQEEENRLRLEEERRQEEERRRQEAEAQRLREEEEARVAEEERLRREEEERVRREEEERVAAEVAAVERMAKAMEDAVRKGDIPTLVKMLRVSPDGGDASDEQKEKAAIALRNLASMAARNHAYNWVAIREEGGIELLVEMAKGGAPRGKEWATRALRNLAGNEQNKKLIAQAGFYLGGF